MDLPSSDLKPASSARLRRRAPAVGLLAAAAVLLLVLLGPAGSAILRLERAFAQAVAGAPFVPPEQSSVVIVDVEKWPRELSSLNQALLRIWQRKPRVVVLDIFADVDSRLGEAVLDGEFFADPLTSTEYPVLLAAQMGWFWDAAAGAFVPGPVSPPVDGLQGVHLGLAALGPPQLMENDEPILAVGQVFTDEQGGGWLGLGLAAALLHSFTQLTPGTWPQEVTSERVVFEDRQIVLDAGRLWMARVPQSDDFFTVPLSALAGATVDPALLARFDGKVVLFGLVGSTSNLDTHRTAAGWRRGVLIHAGQIEQIIEGRSFLPVSGPVSTVVACAFLLLGALITLWVESPWRAGFWVLGLGALGLIASLLCLRFSWTLAPPFRPLCGALLGCAGVAGGRVWTLHVELKRFRTLPARSWSADPVAELFRRCHIQRLLANELVRSRSWTASTDPAFAEQDKEQRVFRHSDRVERRIAGMEWQLGSPSGVKDVVEILYLSLYEGSGALKRIPEELKRPGSPIFVLKHLRNYFDHSYELAAKVRRRLDEALATWAGACLADLQSGARDLLQRVQVRLLEQSNTWLEALQERLRKELRGVHIAAPCQTWLARQPRFLWLWEGEARGWRIELRDQQGQSLLDERVDGALRAWDAPADLTLGPGLYTAHITLQIAAKGGGPTVSSAFQLPEANAPLGELLPASQRPQDTSESARVRGRTDIGALREEICALVGAQARGLRLLETGVFWSEAAVELFPEAASSVTAGHGLERALKELQIPEEVVLRVLLWGGRARAPAESPQDGQRARSDASLDV